MDQEIKIVSCRTGQYVKGIYINQIKKRIKESKELQKMKQNGKVEQEKRLSKYKTPEFGGRQTTSVEIEQFPNFI